jgi:hypothetical protein
MFGREFESEWESFADGEDFEDFEADPFLGGLIGSLGQALGGMLGEEEREGAFEGEWEDELELGEDFEAESAAALMEMLAGQIAEADSEAEADQFLPILGALAPLAMKALPFVAKAAPAIGKIAARVVPQVARGVMSIGKRMLASPAARQAVRTLPTIARNATAQVLRTHAAGRPVNAQTVTRALAQQTARVLRDPRRRRACIHRSRRVAGAAKRRLTGAAR